MLFKLKSPLLLSLLATTLFLSACKKKEGCTDPTAVNYDATAEKDCCCDYDSTFHLEMHMHPFMGADPILEGQTLTINGVATKLDIFRFYVSNFRLVDAAGNETPQEGLYLLVKPDPDEYVIGDMPAGNYTKVRFDIGIDSLTNHGDPTQYALGTPLGGQFPEMHWSWSIGYIFMRIDGETDINGDGTPDPDGSFQMHLGTDDYLAHIEIDYPINSIAGADFTLHLNVLWNKFFEGVDMTGDVTTHTTDNVPLADILFSNITHMIVPEE